MDAAPDSAVPRWSRRELALVGAMLAVVVAAYHRSVLAGFTNWDDNRFIVDNPLYHQGGWAYVHAALTRIQFEAYQPLHLLSYLPDRYLWPDTAAGFHAVELALFVGDVALAYALLRRHAGARAALIACTLFALHPLCVEPVAWITSRKDLVSFAFFVGALLIEDRRDPTRARPVLGAVALGAAAMLTQTSTVCLPLVVAAWLYFARGARPRVALLRALPYAVVAAVCAAVVWWLWHDQRLVAEGRALPAVVDVASTLGTYLGRIVVPIDLAAAYPRVPLAPWIAAIGFVVAVAAIALAWRRLPPLARFAAVGALATLLPVANIVPMRGHFADRYTFLALFAIAAGIAALIARAGTRRWVLALVAVVAAAEGVATWRGVAVWHDSRALWSRAVAAQPDAVFAHYKLGETLRDAHDWPGAVAQYQAAIRLEPDRSIGYAGLLYVYATEAEALSRIAPGTARRWLDDFLPSLAAAPTFSRYYAAIPYDACPACSNLVLGVGLTRWPQPDPALIDAAGRALDAGRRDTALVYLASVKDRATAGFTAAARRAGAM